MYTRQPIPQSEELLGPLGYAGQLTQQTKSLPGILLHSVKQKSLLSRGPAGEQLHTGQQLDCSSEDPTV